MDVKGFKKVGQTKTHTIFEHPSGHMLHVAHEGLPSSHKKELKKLEMSSDAQKMSKGGKVTPPSVEHYRTLTQHTAGHYAGGTPEGTVADQMAQDGPYQPTPMFQENAPVDIPPTPNLAPESNPIKVSGTINAPQPQADVNEPDPFGTRAYSSAYTKGLEQQQAGIANTADAQAVAADKEAKAAEQNIQSLRKLQSVHDMKVKELDVERNALKKDIIDAKIDPNHFFNSMGTGQKITSAIGLLLGGLGAGMAGGENPVEKFLVGQVERDIQAQKMNLGKKENLLSHNMKEYGNERDAMNATRLNQMDLMAAQIQKIAAQSKSPQQQAAAQQALGKLQMESAPIAAQLAKQKTLMEGANHVNDPAMLVPMAVPKEHQEGVYKEIERAQNTKHMEKNILDAFDQSVNENTVMKTGAGLIRTPASVGALHQHMQPTFADLEGTVRQAAMDNTFKNITPSPGDTKHTIATKRQALEEYLQSKKSAPRAKSYGINLDKFKSTNVGGERAPEARTMGGVKYVKVPGGWKKAE